METGIEIKYNLDDGKRKSELLTLDQKSKVTKIEEDESNSRKKPGRKRLELSETKTKKEKNRVAQRAWRERKEKYVLELEAKISELEEAKNKTENEKQQLRLIIEKLKSENIYLKSTSFIFTPNEETKNLLNQSKLNIQNQITNNTFNNTFTNIQNNSISNPSNNLNQEYYGSNSILHSIQHPNSKIQPSLNTKDILNNPILSNTTTLQPENIYSKSNINNSNELNHQEPTPPMNTNDYGLEMIPDNNNVVIDNLFNTINYNFIPTTTSATPLTKDLAGSILNGNKNNTINNNVAQTLAPKLATMNSQISKDNQKDGLINDIYLSLIEQNLKQDSLSTLQSNEYSANQNLNNMFIVNKLNNNSNSIFETSSTSVTPNINNESLLINNSMNSTLPFLLSSSNNTASLDTSTPLATTSSSTTSTTNSININSLPNNIITSISENTNNFSELLMNSNNNTNSNSNSFEPILPITESTTQSIFTNYKPIATTGGEFNNDLAIQLSKQQPLNTLTNDVSNMFTNVINIPQFTDIEKKQNLQQNILSNVTNNNSMKISNNNAFTNPSFTLYRDTTSASATNTSSYINPLYGDDDNHINDQLISDDLFNTMIQQIHKQNEGELIEDDDEFDIMKKINNNSYINTPITPEMSLKESSSEVEEMEEEKEQQPQLIKTPQSLAGTSDIQPETPKEEEQQPIKETPETTTTTTTTTTESEEKSTQNEETSKKTSMSTLQFPEKQKPTKLNIPYAVFPRVSQDTVDSFINDARLTDEELDCLCLELKKKATCKEKLKYIQSNMSIEGWSMEKWEKGRMKKKVTTSS